ncbi:hypothetical protein QI003_09230 [Bacillus stercoris]|nr:MULTISPECIES: hypothetical protein [Bacillus]POO83808.1 hypothetical protein C1T30_00650 [Bacillus sp. MBGLi97]ASB60980.1 hypothetical protein CDO84_08215 [Bacillus sp. MD-5]MCB7153009.1 hypothetical protein [Bacillus stercoris]MDL9995964.1 hypothetical protein [Bacillus stercoris]MEC2059266.1 hypothetical protein [Bacillus stercoris]
MKRIILICRPIRDAGPFSYILLYLLILYSSIERSRKTIGLTVGKINLTDNIYRGYHQLEHATIYPVITIFYKNIQK